MLLWILKGPSEEDKRSPFPKPRGHFTKFYKKTATCTHLQESVQVPNAEAEAPILWPPDVKSRLIKEDPGAEKD